MVLIAMLAGWAPPALGANECSPYGICAHLPADSDQEMIKAAGIDWVRLDVNWFQLEPSKGNFQWGYLDKIFDKSHSLGLNVFATLSYTPQWAAANKSCAPGQGGCSGCNTQTLANVGDWQNFVTQVVNRYKGKVKHWGMWNEPNLEHFYCGSPDQYINEILIPGAQAAKAADPSCVVLGPELAGVGGSDAWNGDEGTCLFGACIFNGWELSLGYVLSKAGTHIDIIAHHFYKDHAKELATILLDGEYNIVKTHSSLKELRSMGRGNRSG